MPVCSVIKVGLIYLWVSWMEDERTREHQPSTCFFVWDVAVYWLLDQLAIRGSCCGGLATTNLTPYLIMLAISLVVLPMWKSPNKRRGSHPYDPYVSIIFRIPLDWYWWRNWSKYSLIQLILDLGQRALICGGPPIVSLLLGHSFCLE